ncbi:MAG: NAD-dependent succinate-semialdehyde dehydrogenase [Flavobacteriales bacterium]|nr:NAD-dependent succinate-semialdehyde dehydrogenase [Flavobacteriales bacterium]
MQQQVQNSSVRTFQSINPENGNVVGEYTEISDKDLNSALELSGEAFQDWKKISLETRCKYLQNASKVLLDNAKKYAEMITLEMGKPISESMAEIKKCAWVCDYYAENAVSFLAPEIIQTDASKSYVNHLPLGTIFAIMPWNFPFWQVFRFAAPTLTAGNTGILKHAPNVFGCAELIAEVFREAGYPKGVFQNLIVHHDQTEKIIAHSTVKAVTLTGSEAAGKAVAEIAGRHLKKSLLELGGSNAFVVLEDADIDASVKTALTARFLNCGQSCIAAKRFIVHANVYDEFLDKFVKAIKTLKTGDLMDPETSLGPLARKDLADQLQDQVKRSKEMGAEIVLGGNQNNCYHEATILTGVKPGMPAFDEESFGPLAAITKVHSEDEAIKLANLSRFGLGITVCTRDTEKATSLAYLVDDGAFFVNELVKSDPRLPFGGTKSSGYGRELAKQGMMEFLNVQTVYIK